MITVRISNIFLDVIRFGTHTHTHMYVRTPNHFPHIYSHPTHRSTTERPTSITSDKTDEWTSSQWWINIYIFAGAFFVVVALEPFPFQVNVLCILKCWTTFALSSKQKNRWYLFNFSFENFVNVNQAMKNTCRLNQNMCIKLGTKGRKKWVTFATIFQMSRNNFNHRQHLRLMISTKHTIDSFFIIAHGFD